MPDLAANKGMRRRRDVNVLIRGMLVCIPLLGGCGKMNETGDVVAFVSPAPRQEQSAHDPMPQMFGPGGDALLAEAEREISETQDLVRELRKKGIVRDDLDVINELARKIKDGTMTPEDEKRLQRMTHAAERQLELERLRHRCHQPQPPHRHKPHGW